MKILVTGSRDWSSREAIWDAISGACDPHWRECPYDVVLIHGGARGADTIAGEYATYEGIEVIVCLADWNKYGKSAGVIRNNHMLDMDPDVVLAFQRNKSRGTQHCIGEARRRGIPVKLFEETT